MIICEKNICEPAEHIRDSFLEMAKYSRFDVFDERGLVGVCTGLNSAALNVIFDYDCEPGVYGDAMRTLAGRFSEKGLPYMVLRSSRDEVDGRVVLGELGCVHAVDAICLEYCLGNDIEESPVDLGFNIREVLDEELDQWDSVAADAFGIIEGGSRAVLEDMWRHGGDTHMYVAYYGEELVGVSLLNIVGDVAGNYWDAVKEGFRGKGIGTELAKVRMRKAKKRGCSKIVCQCYPDSVNLYRRLGFIEVGVLECYCST